MVGLRLSLRSRATTWLMAAIVAWYSGRQAAASYPATQFVRLPDARRLEYAEYGNRSGPLVLYFHGTPGSHLEVGAVNREIQAAGLHIVAVNRPGIGRSSYQCGRTITKWPQDVACLLEGLGYGEQPFGLIGFSGGAPYALACARAMPERISHLAIVSGHAPPGAPGVKPGEEDHLIAIFRRRTRLAHIAVDMTTRRLQRRPDSVVDRVTKRWNPADRKLILGNPSLKQRLLRSLEQSTLCGSDGIVTDVQLLGGRWCFDLAEVGGMPISIWQGECDRIVPVSMGRYLHARLVGSGLATDRCAGHVTMFLGHAAEIFAEFAAAGHSQEIP